MSTILHRGTVFVISDGRGDLARAEHGFYFEDVRCLARLCVTVDGRRLVPLAAWSSDHDRATFVLTNPETRSLAASKLSVRRERVLGATLADRLTIDSFADETVEVEVALALGADFADIYAVKKQALAGNRRAKHAHDVPLERDGERVVLRRDVDGARCASHVAFSRPPEVGEHAVSWRVRLARGETWVLALEVESRIEHPGAVRSTRALATPSESRRRAHLERAACTLESDHPILATAYERAAADLVALRLSAEENIEGETAIAAGIPWYMALFGRDSLIAAYQSVLHDPELARGTLVALAHLQGRRVDEASEEQPGRILHEYRKHLRGSPRRNIPKFPYYGTIDATPLWLVTLSEYVRATGDLDTAAALWPNAERAIAWIEKYGDRDGDGLVEYQTPPHGFLKSEGWKDSPDSVRFADGRIARQPIALVEVQGYVADAYARMAELEARLGRGDGARLRERAERTRRLIAEKFWIAEQRQFAEALDGDKRAVDSRTSNPGHLLWSRAVDEERAGDVARMLLSRDLFTGWGVRTMGSGEGGYDPVSYHDGSVWPHDNALALEGLARYRRGADVARLAGALLDALAAQPDLRFPELWSGFARDEVEKPVAYPNANKPQAWASGAVLLLARAILGIEVDAARKVLAVRPTPIAGASRIALHNVPVGGKRLTLAVRFGGGAPRTTVDGLPGDWRLRLSEDSGG